MALIAILGVAALTYVVLAFINFRRAIRAGFGHKARVYNNAWLYTSLGITTTGSWIACIALASVGIPALGWIIVPYLDAVILTLVISGIVGVIICAGYRIYCPPLRR